MSHQPISDKHCSYKVKINDIDKKNYIKEIEREGGGYYVIFFFNGKNSKIMQDVYFSIKKIRRITQYIFMI